MSDEYINLDADNVAQHHLCCALGDPKHAAGVDRKRAWLRRRFAEGLVFRKLDVRGKVFIEYMPAEACWRPIEAPGWLVIHCLWVSGRYAGHGHGRALVDYCVEDARARGKAGVVVAASKHKRPFLSDPRFFAHLGFEVVDEAGEWRLFALPVDTDAQKPRFARSMHHKGRSTGGKMAMRHADQCPFNTHWAEEMAERLRSHGHDVAVERLTRSARARRSRSPLGAFALERDGELLTHHLNTPGGVDRLLAKQGL